MNIFRVTWNKVSILHCSVLKMKIKKDRLRLYVLGIPLCCPQSVRERIWRNFLNATSFDVSSLDREIEETYAGNVRLESAPPCRERIAFLATELYDMGGHSKWMRDMQQTLREDYRQKLFVTNNRSEELAPGLLAGLRTFSEVCVYHQFAYWSRRNARKIARDIAACRPHSLFVFIHPDDVVGAAVLAILRKHTNIRIFYVNHATHRPCLGMSFADLVLEETHCTAYITQKLRHIPQTHIVGLISKREEDTPQFSPSDISRKRQDMGLPPGAFCTMSGASAYKYFEKDDSPYFRMIKQLLRERPNVYHVFISKLSDAQKEVIERIFGDSAERQRLLILPFQDDYERAFASADLFIDSFPMSSALTFVDLMRLKVPYVVKINRENAALSFHEYQAEDFPCMYEHAEEMLEGIKYLMEHPQAREAMTIANYAHYLKRYEPRVARNILNDLIHAENPREMYDSLREGVSYHFNFNFMM